MSSDETDRVLTDLTVTMAQIRTKQARIEARVQDLRAAGVPWEQIADALGVSRQAAWKRYGSRTLDHA